MISVPDAPQIPGLSFRAFKDASDFELMVSLARSSLAADKVDYFEVAADIENEYRASPDRSPRAEILFAEIKGEPVGFARIWMDPGRDGLTEFWHVAHVVPEWRNTGLRLALARYNENQIIAMVKGHEIRSTGVCKTWALNEPSDWTDLISAEGYSASIHFYEMVRPNLDDLPETRVPAGLEIRPVSPEDYPRIWEASREAFRGKPWFIEENYDAKYYQAWLESSAFQPELWKVAWDGDEVVGNARNEISADQNQAFGRKRGHTQHLSVLPKWRRRGLGTALLVESLKMMRENGLEEAGLDVETQSTTGELKLYLGLGYQIHRRYAHFLKPLGPLGGK